MNNKKLLLIYLVQLILTISFFYMAYLQTFMLEVFEWGNVNNDGLYLLLIPFIVLPIILIAGLVKWMVLRKLRIDILFRISQWIYLVMGLVILASSSVQSYWLGFVIGIAGGVLSSIEPIFLKRNLTK